MMGQQSPPDSEIAIYASLDGELEVYGPDVYLGGFFQDPIGGGVEKAFSYDLELFYLYPGTYNIFIVADRHENVTETDEDNNIVNAGIVTVEEDRKCPG